MKITQLNIPEGHSALRATHPKGFGQVVYLAGPNGGGKTRVLKFIEWAVSAQKQPHEIAQLKANVQQYIQIANQQALEASRREVMPDAQEPAAQAQIAQLRQTESSQRSNANARQQQLDIAELLVVDEPSQKPQTIDFSFNNTQLNDPRNQNLGQIEQALASLKSGVGLGNIATQGLSAVTAIFRQYFAATHPERKYQFSDTERAESQKTQSELLQLVRDLVGVEIAPGKTSDDPQIGDRPVTEASLSKGQIVLLIAAMALHFHGNKLDQLILLIDEPENHLHPKAVIEVIQRLQTACPQGQIWVATHSVHLLAQANTNDIWFVKDGHLQHGGSKTQEVLNSLLGGEEGQEQLATFLARPAQYAATHFAMQCLGAPLVADTPAHDPQTSQIRQTLQSLRTKKNAPLRVLDYGAGRGRLLTELAESAAQAGTTLASDWDYFAYNDALCTPTDCTDTCIQRIAQHYPDASRRHIDSADRLGEINPASVDVILMCNVLHEISPSEWPSTFEHYKSLLTADGYLLIVEDQVLPVGERAHECGFLVLDSLQIKTLFGMQPEDSRCVSGNHPVVKYATRLRTHLVPASVMGQFTIETRKKCLESLKKLAYEKASALLAKQADSRTAKQLAFWTQQHFFALQACDKY